MHATMTKAATQARPKSKPTLQRGGVSLGRWFGIEIRLEPSWFVIFALLTFSFSNMLAGAHPYLVPAIHWIVALLGSVLFFGSILTHELAHSLVAIRTGVPVHSITLHIFGGVSRLGSEAKSPWDEFRIAVVGPLTSAALGTLFLGIARATSPSSIANCIVSWLGYVNLGLAAFNLLPGFPLDGGRVLRSILWAVKGNPAKASQVAHRAGEMTAYGLILIGVALAFGLREFMNGLWLGFMGWFLLSAAQSSRIQTALRDVLGRLRVDDVMKAPPVPAFPETAMETLVNDRILKTGERAFLVCEGDRLLGLVTLHEIKRVPREEWELTPLRQVMVPLEDLTRVSPSDSLVQAFEKLDEQAVNQLPVLDHDRLVGMLNREDMLRLVSSHLELGNRSTP